MNKNNTPTASVTTRNGLKVSGLVLTFKSGRFVGSNLPTREESRAALRDFAAKYDMRRACDRHPQGCPSECAR